MKNLLIFTANDGVKVYEGDTYYYVANEAILLVRKQIARNNQSVDIHLCAYTKGHLAQEWIDAYYKTIANPSDVITDNPPIYHPRNSTIELQQKFYNQLKSGYDQEIFETQEWLREKVYATSIECAIISVTDTNRYCVNMELYELQKMKNKK